MAINFKSVAIVGLGVWGRKILAELVAVAGSRKILLIGRHPENQILAKKIAKRAEIFSSISELTTKPDLAIICTQASRHFECLSEFLKMKVPCLVEKPFCTSVSEAARISGRFKRAGVALGVDHTYMYSPTFHAFARAFRKYRGNFVYTSDRLDFGSFPKDVNLLENLTYHDLYVLNELVGLKTLKPDHLVLQENNSTLILKGGRKSQFILNASNVNAHKVRNVTVRGPKGCLIWNDLNVGKEVIWTPFRNNKKMKPVAFPGRSKRTSLHNLLTTTLSRGPDGRSVEIALQIKSLLERIT